MISIEELKTIFLSNKKKAIIGICFLLLILLTEGVYVYFIHKVSSPANPNIENKTFVVPSGKGASWIAQRLEEEELISNDFYFKTYIFLKNLRKKLQAGEYLLNGDMSIKEIAYILAQGKVAFREVEIIIPEGFRASDIEKRLMEKDLVEQGEFMKLVNNPTEELINNYSFLEDKPNNKGLEGYLFPDTYRFFRETSPADIIGKMLDNFNSQLTDELRQEIEKQQKTVYEVITLASIVQNEVNSSEDMRKVAGIFFNRLEIGQALQSDATINYITGKKLRQPTSEDIKVKSDYNTYLYPGLPPGPISSPGIEAIKAVIFPQDTDYLYFLNPIDGSTIFSKTLQEHNANRAKYLP